MWGCSAASSGGGSNGGSAGVGANASGGSSASGGLGAFGASGGTSGFDAGTGGVAATGAGSGSGGASVGGTSGFGASGGASGFGGTSGSGGVAGLGGSGGTSGSGGLATGGTSGSGGSGATGGASGGSGGAGGSGGSGTGGSGGLGGCISGATGSHAIRFRWAGNGSGSTAYVVYELNNLPDTSNYKVGSYSQSISYKPVFADVFLAQGGLDLEGTAFIDVDLSTIGLSSIKKVTLAIYGRSFNTTASGSFNWQTFQGTGASPYGGVSNVAPYQWYGADATAAFNAGNGGVKLRIKPDGPSNALIVNRVEVCFDAT